MADKIKNLWNAFVSKVKKNIPFAISLTVMILAGIGLVIYLCFYFKEAREVSKSVEELKAIKQQILLESELTPQPEMIKDAEIATVPTEEPSVTPGQNDTKEHNDDSDKIKDNEPTLTPEPAAEADVTPSVAEPGEIVMLPEGEEYYNINNDYVGWLVIPDTVIDYPVVMEKPEDENYYLKYWFDGTTNKNGTLFTLTECEVGVGCLSDADKEGYTKPTTNILIFGHNQKSGKMFGTLSKFLDKEFCEIHSILKFDTAYEHREYKLIAVFRSHVFMQNETDFKYYYFYNAENEEEFNYWLKNIKEKDEIGLPDSAVYGDEFITLSTCSDTNEFGEICDNGRLAVVFKRVK